MVMKDKKPAEKKEKEKEPIPIIPPRAETPRLLKAALVMTEKTGMKGTWSKLKDRSNRSSVSLQVYTLNLTQHNLINIIIYRKYSFYIYIYIYIYICYPPPPRSNVSWTTAIQCDHTEHHCVCERQGHYIKTVQFNHRFILIHTQRSEITFRSS